MNKNISDRWNLWNTILLLPFVSPVLLFVCFCDKRLTNLRGTVQQKFTSLSSNNWQRWTFAPTPFLQVTIAIAKREHARMCFCVLQEMKKALSRVAKQERAFSCATQTEREFLHSAQEVIVFFSSVWGQEGSVNLKRLEKWNVYPKRGQRSVSLCE